jgi:hypothetical protein
MENMLAKIAQTFYAATRVDESNQPLEKSSGEVL